MDRNTGHIYSAEMMRAMAEATGQLLGRDNVDPKVLPKELVEITDEQYAAMEGMNRKQRRTYMAKKSCPCGSRKRRNACCYA